MASVEIVSLHERDRWEAAHRDRGLPSQSWAYAWGLAASGIDPKLGIVVAGGSRMLLPFFEREWDGTIDIATVQSLSGASIEPLSPAPLEAWREFAGSEGWVAGYLQLAPVLVHDRALVPPGDDLVSTNAVFLLDTEGHDFLAAASYDIRRKVRRAEAAGVSPVTDRAALAAALVPLYRETMARTGATAVYDVSDETLERWAHDPTTLVLGAALDGSIQAISMFSTAGDHAESHIMASTTAGQSLAGWLMWSAMKRLRDAGIHKVNLGGGVRPGDGVYAFKERFNGERRPLLAVRQVYDRRMYEELCERAGADPAGDWFPPYRRSTVASAR